MWDKLKRFMTGRYGNDPLNIALTIIALVFFFASMLWKPFYIVSLLLLVLVPFRMFSRKIDKRAAEGKAYEKLKGQLVDNLVSLKQLTVGTKTHCYFRCPNCKKMVRVPRGKGKVIIHCSNCQTSYTKST